MANISLKTITFPGLDDKYTIPQVDNALTTVGAAADAKAVGDEIRSIKADLDSLGDGVPTEVRQAMLALFNSAAYAETGLTDEIAVIESWAAVVTAISLNQSSISISGASTSQLVATTTPAGGTVAWASSDTSVATVSSSGLVTGVGNGSCTITASCGGYSATCSVTVSGFATLTSISTVYTQSGTVYDTDSLDSLKADLVVTANYSDSTTETVTDYILSGTLAVGTSTITVAYGGKTTTFSVTVSVRTVSVENGAVSVSDGSESASTTRARTDYIPCSNRVFAIDAKINTSNVVSYACRYFDASYNYIGHSDSFNMTPVPDHSGGGEYLIDGWPAGNGTEYTDATPLSGTVAYVRFLMRTTAGSETITDVSGTVTVDGIEYTIAYS